jgi:hypothetical protein
MRFAVGREGKDADACAIFARAMPIANPIAAELRAVTSACALLFPLNRSDAGKRIELIDETISFSISYP